MRSIYLFSAVCIELIFMSCQTKDKGFQATGHFEAQESVVSAEAQGVIVSWDIEEGSQLDSGQIIGRIDDTDLKLRKAQLEAQYRAITAKRPDVSTLTQSFDEQWKTAKSQLDHWLNEKKRFEKLVAGQGATQKQLDDILAQVDLAQKQLEVIKAQKKAQQSSLNTQISGLDAEKEVVKTQLAQVDENIRKCTIVNPFKGTVLSKYAEKREMAIPGKALYSIADVSTLQMRAYITGNQLPQLKLGQNVTVRIDDGNGGYKTYSGTLTWISSKSEFTPKTIQTKEERADKVYAVKVRVKNDGFLKIGMYGELIW